MFACCVSVGMFLGPFVRMASTVSVLSLYLLLRPHMSFQSLQEFVLYVMPSTSCFHLAVCLRLISSSISEFSTLIVSRASGVGICFCSWAHEIEFLFDVPIETWIKVSCSACGNMSSVCVSDCFVKVLYSQVDARLNVCSCCSIVAVKEGQSARLYLV